MGVKEYTYNSNGKISSVKTSATVTDAQNRGAVTVNYEYDYKGRIKSIKKSEKVLDKPFEKQFSYGYDGKLVSIRTKTEKLLNGKVKTVEDVVNLKGKSNTSYSSGGSSSSYSSYSSSRSSNKSHSKKQQAKEKVDNKKLLNEQEIEQKIKEHIEEPVNTKENLLRDNAIITYDKRSPKNKRH